MKKFTSLMLALLMLLGLLTACGGESGEPAPENAGTRIITDMAGREVEIPADVRSVAALESTARMITYAGGADKITGLTETEQKGRPGMPYAYVNREHFAACTAIAPGGPTSEYYEEALVTLQPDVIFTFYSDMDEINTMQEKLGIPVLCMAFQGMFDPNVYASILLAGEVLGTQEKAEATVKALKGWEADLDARTKDIPDDKKPSVYAGAVSFAGGHGIEGSYANYPPFMAIHANNVVDETGEKASVMIDKEKLLVWDPDIIFLTPGNLHFVQDDYKVNPDLYNNLSAFQNGKVYSQVGYNWYYTNVELAVCDAYYAGMMIYPEAFSDLDFEAKAEEIFTTMLGEPYYSNLELTGDFFGPITLEDIQ